MHVRSLTLTTIRGFLSLVWKPEAPSAGWHVILGSNGSGKSSLLRAFALALVGPKEGLAMREAWADWLSADSEGGDVMAWVSMSPEYDRVAGKGRKFENHPVPAYVHLGRGRGEVKPEAPRFVLQNSKRVFDGDRYMWSGNRGWFSAGFGPMRRFRGGDRDQERLYFTNPRLARHLTLFGEDVALTEALTWLKQLRFEALEAEERGETEGGEPGKLLKQLTAFVNQEGFLRHGVRLDSVTSKDVLFVDGNGLKLSVDRLSDGFRSILSLTFELIRQLAQCYGADQIFDPEDPTRIIVPGVVLIDEVDAHLHASWQREIGFFFTRHFPEIQFIVATHSPLVCQAAVSGSIFRLAPPGTGEPSRMVSEDEYNRLVYGNVLDAYGTASFGITAGGRSDEARVKLRRLAELAEKEFEEGISKEEKRELEALRGLLPTAATSAVDKSA